MVSRAFLFGRIKGISENWCFHDLQLIRYEPECSERKGLIFLKKKKKKRKKPKRIISLCSWTPNLDDSDNTILI